MSRISAICLAALVIIAVPGCETVGPVLDSVLATAPKPSASVGGARIADFSATGATIELDVDVENPYSVPLPLSALRYTVGAGDNTDEALLTGSVAEGRILPAGRATTVPVPVEIDFQSLLAAKQDIRLGTLVPYATQLDVILDPPGGGEEIVLPLRQRGEIPVPAPPRVNVEGIDWDERSLARTAGTLRVALTNANEFPMTLREMDYAFELGRTQFAAGKLSRTTEFAAGETQTLEIPFSLSLADLGMGALGMLRERELQYEFDGTFDLDLPEASYTESVEKTGLLGL